MEKICQRNHPVHELDAGYRSDVDRIDEDGWYLLLEQFDDASIYQTWAYGQVRSDVKTSAILS